MSVATLTRTITDSQPLPGSYGREQTIRQAVSESSENIPVLVIGDLHGHLDRFEALLKQEGLLDRCEACDGCGTTWEPCTLPGTQCEYSCDHDRTIDCLNCDGLGWARTNKLAKVVLVGDIGHFGLTKLPDGRKVPGSATADLLTWQAALLWADVILWGNHDRALVSERHAFGGYMKPLPEVYNFIETARWEGKLKLAYSAHGFLITHAGLHLAFRDNKGVPDQVKRDPIDFAYWINAVEPESYHGTPAQIGVRDAISSKRGGGATAGGILWRDVTEKLYPFRQVFGHSADHSERAVRYCSRYSYTRHPKDAAGFENLSYCIDVGGPDEWGKSARCLAGIWLPEERIVRVDL